MKTQNDMNEKTVEISVLLSENIEKLTREIVRIGDQVKVLTEMLTTLQERVDLHDGTINAMINDSE